MAAETSKPSNKITLKTSDNQLLEVEKAFILESQTIKHIIEDDCADNIIPIPNVTGDTMKLIIEYCTKHAEFSEKKKKKKGKGVVSVNDDETDKDKGVVSLDDEIKAWDSHFINVDNDTLFNLLLAANFLSVKSLVELATQRVADMIKGKKPEEIRETFNIKYDLTPEQEEEHMKQYYWAYE